jgi:hypothetical protein
MFVLSTLKRDISVPVDEAGCAENGKKNNDKSQSQGG